jgi:GNAT superfamily N-acetyltransferase
MHVRRATPEDVAAIDGVARDVLFDVPHDRDEGNRARRSRPRIAHLIETDPGGAWVADDDGAVVGAALALIREGIWGFSLFALAESHQGRGIGRELFARCWDYGATARGHLILSSADPAALRIYATTRLPLRPCVAAAGIADLTRAPRLEAVEQTGEEGIAVADAIGRELRGAGHGRDLHVPLRNGARMLMLEDRAFAVYRETDLVVLGARDDAAAVQVLWGFLVAAGAGATVTIDFLTAGQDWAVRACVDAGLALSPVGPMFAGGELGPLAPYVPSGAYL